MSSDDVSIRVSQVGKSYQLYRRPEHRFLQSLFRGKRQFYQEFRALDGITFDVLRGETLGVIGRNGSGKSTLLEIIAGTLTPTSGSVRVNGRVSAILELGAGFNPEFTGRENVVLSTAIRGMTRAESDARMDDIVRFSDIGEYIDQPVKTYSSGMYARLAFAVAIHTDPDVLIVDEALAVGDAKFQAQCFRKFDEFKRSGVTILFVTHSVEQIIRHCSRALLLDRGTMVMLGPAKEVVARYLELLFGIDAVRRRPAAPPDEGAGPVALAEAFLGRPGSDAGDPFALRPTYNRLEHRWGDGRAQILDYALLDSSGREAVSFATGAPVAVVLKIAFLADVAQPIYGLTVKTPDGVQVGGTNSRDSVIGSRFVARRAGEIAYVRFQFSCHLIGGEYMLSVGVAEESPTGVEPLDRRYDSIVLQVASARKSFGIVELGVEIAQSAAAPDRPPGLPVAP